MIERRLIRIAYFTENGAKLSTKISAGLMNDVVETKPEDICLKEWTRDCFDYKLPIIFIGSVGIAVRTIAPFVANKLTDCPVVVVDELGENAIPILSGHYGGANDLARQIAAIINANAVITTATDINNVFAVDVFAKKNGLFITEKDKIKQVSSKALKGEKLEIKQNEKYIEIEGLKLVPRRIILGIGCKKGKSFEELNEFVKANYSEEELRDSLYGICCAYPRAHL